MWDIILVSLILMEPFVTIHSVQQFGIDSSVLIRHLIIEHYFLALGLSLCIVVLCVSKASDVDVQDSRLSYRVAMD